MELTCSQCSKPIAKKPGPGRNPKYCSPRCADDAYDKRRRADGRRAAYDAARRGPASACRGCSKPLRSGSTRCRACYHLRLKADARRARVAKKGELAAAGTAGHRPWACGRCRYCGAWFACQQLTIVHCSRRCKGKTREGERRARQAGVKLTPGRRYAVYERDDWVCQLCGLDVDRDAPFPEPLSPTVDHRVPLAAGGPHNEDNWQTAHFICNSHKRDLV